MPDEDFEAAGELLRVLAAPVRLAIITRLAEGPTAVHALTEQLDVPQPLVSHHLRILRSARLVEATAYGRERVYALVDDHVAHIVADAVRHSAETADVARPAPDRPPGVRAPAHPTPDHHHLTGDDR